MAQDSTVAAKKRTKLGSAVSRRLRLQGLVPGIVYGHNQDPQPITIENDILRPVILSGHRVVDLDIEGSVEKAIIRAVQYDTFGQHIDHIDLLRVDPTERVTVDVPLELKGTAIGTMSGGVLEQPIHSIRLDCLAYQLPDSIVVRIGNLGLGQSLHVSDLELPEGVHCQTPADAVVAHVIQVSTKALDAVAAPGEPEVIGKKAEDDGDAAKDAPKKK